MEEHVINKSKKLNLILLLTSLVFVMGAIHMVINPRDTFMTIIGIVGIIFFSLGLIVVLRELIDTRPLLTINKNGFIYNSNRNNLELILWEHVELIYTRYIYSNHFIYVDIKDTDELLKNKTRKKLINNSSIMIMVQSKKQLNEAFKLMMKYNQAYHKTQDV